MKAELLFDLPEEQDEFRRASCAQELAGTLTHIDECCRKQLKHGDALSREMAMNEIRNIINDVRHLL